MDDKHADTPDVRLAKLAARQHGVVSARQLYALGLTRQQVHDRRRAARLHSIHRGVYAVGIPNLTREGRFMAAVLAGGDGAVLSHGSAAWLWGIRDGLLSPVDVTVATSGGRKHRPGIRIHRTRGLLESTIHRRIPITTVPRTLIDLAEVLTPRQLERALDEADHLNLLHLPAVYATLAAHSNRAGTARLEQVVQSHTPGTTRTRSQPEEAFLAFCRRHRLPQPILNARVCGYVVDALFPEQRVVVEIDPWHTHSDPRAFAADRARDRTLLAAGFRTIRLADGQLDERAAADLRAIL